MKPEPETLNLVAVYSRHAGARGDGEDFRLQILPLLREVLLSLCKFHQVLFLRGFRIATAVRKQRRKKRTHNVAPHLKVLGHKLLDEIVDEVALS